MTTPTGTLLEGLDDEDLDRLARRLAPRLGRNADPERLMNTEEAATHLRCSPDRIYDLVRTRHLVPKRDGRRLLFPRRVLDEYLADDD